MAFRISVYLNYYFTDHKSVCKLFVGEKMKKIGDLEDHISELFSIKDFYLISQSHYLPTKEDIRILNQDDIVLVIPRNIPSQDSSIFNMPKKIKKRKTLVTDDVENDINIKKGKKKRKKIQEESPTINVSNCNLNDENQSDGAKRKKKKTQHTTNEIISPQMKIHNSKVSKREKTKSSCYANQIGDMHLNQSCNVKIDQEKIGNEDVIKSQSKSLSLAKLENGVSFVKVKLAKGLQYLPVQNQKENNFTDYNLKSLLEQKTECENLKTRQNKIEEKLNLSKQEVAVSPSIDKFGVGGIMNLLRQQTTSTSTPNLQHKRKRIRIRKRKNQVDISSNIAVPLNFANKPILSNASPLIHFKFEDKTLDEKANEKLEINDATDHSICTEDVDISSGLNYIDCHQIKNKKLEINGATDHSVCTEDVNVSSVLNYIDCHNIKNHSLDFSEGFIMKCPLMKHLLPKKADIIAFKILKLNEDYTPVLSTYIVSEVKYFCAVTNSVSISVLDGVHQFSSPKGKFNLDEDEIIEEETNFKIVDWPSMLEPRLVSP